MLQQKNLFTKRWQSIVSHQTEASFHIQLVAMLRWCVRPDVLWRHVPNGGWLKDAREGAKLRAMGVLPGCADLEFNWCELDELGRKHRRLLHLELKAHGGRQSEAQASFALAVMLLGDEYHIARTIDEALELLRERGLLRSDVKVTTSR